MTIPALTVDFPPQSLPFPGVSLIQLLLQQVQLTAPVWGAPLVAGTSNGLYVGDGYLGLRLSMAEVNGTAQYSTNHPWASCLPVGAPNVSRSSSPAALAPCPSAAAPPRTPRPPHRRLVKSGGMRFDLKNLTIDVHIALSYDAATGAVEASFPRLNIELGDMRLQTDLALLNAGASKFKGIARGVFVTVLRSTVEQAVPPLLRQVLGASITLPQGQGASTTLHVHVNSAPVFTRDGITIDVSFVPGYSPAIGASAASAAILRTAARGLLISAAAAAGGRVASPLAAAAGGMVEGSGASSWDLSPPTQQRQPEGAAARTDGPPAWLGAAKLASPRLEAEPTFDAERGMTADARLI